MIKRTWQIIRARDWWSSKFPPILAIAYATILFSPIPIYQASLWLLFILGSVSVGAIYVSLINDITDIAEDAASGKANRMAKIPKNVRWLFPTLCITLGLVFQYFFWPDKLSMLLYSLPWISFTLYSCKPFRLKKRRLLGVIADASGSHLFISLLMVSSFSYFTNTNINWAWFAAVGVWSFVYGLRGILYHQFSDRNNDIEANVNTYASGVPPETFKTKQLAITFIELIAFAAMLFLINQIITIVFLILYLIVLFARRKFLGYKIISIIAPKDKPFQIFMADYYQLFFPVSLLIVASITNPACILVLVLQLILFPHKTIDYIKEFRVVIRRKLRA